MKGPVQIRVGWGACPTPKEHQLHASRVAPLGRTKSRSCTSSAAAWGILRKARGNIKRDACNDMYRYSVRLYAHVRWPRKSAWKEPSRLQKHRHAPSTAACMWYSSPSPMQALCLVLIILASTINMFTKTTHIYARHGGLDLEYDLYTTPPSLLLRAYRALLPCRGPRVWLQGARAAVARPSPSSPRQPSSFSRMFTSGLCGQMCVRRGWPLISAGYRLMAQNDFDRNWGPLSPSPSNDQVHIGSQESKRCMYYRLIISYN